MIAEANNPTPAWPMRLASLSVLMLALALLALLGWSMPRGIDLTDEGFYLLNYAFPAKYEASFTYFYLIITRVFGLANQSIVVYRVANLALAVVAATGFGLGLTSWLRTALGPQATQRGLARPSLVVAVVLVGLLLPLSIMPRTLAYNSLNVGLLMLAAGATLQAVQGSWRRAGWLVPAGLALGLDLFVKVSAAGLVGVSIMVLVVYCWRAGGWQAWLRAALALALGLGLGLGWYFWRAQSPAFWWHNFSQEMAVLRGTNYSTGNLATKYMLSLLGAGRVLVWPLGPVWLLAPLLVAWGWRRGHTLAMLASVVALGLWLALFAWRRVWYSTAYLNGLETLSVLLALLLLAALLVLLARRGPAPAEAAATSASWAVAIWLLVLPLLSAAGTVNDLRINLVMDAAPWFGLLITVLAWPQASRLPAWITAVALLLPVGYAAEQIVWGTLRVPYLQVGTATQQTEQLATPNPIGELRLSPPAAVFIRAVGQQLTTAGFRPGDPVLAFYDMPGVVYLVGGYSPGAPWYFKGIDARNCHALDLASTEELHRAYLLVNELVSPELLSCLAEHNLQFPTGYRLVGEVPNAYLDNTYRYRQQQKTVRIYAPLP